METRVILVTYPERNAAAELATRLLNEKLCACVNILSDITSIYSWQGKIETSSEVLLFIKTNAATLPALEKRVHELHPYSTPEFIALTPEHVAEPYAKWLADVLQ
jgi:periplasmic divalent cation tolerance protein